MENFAFYSRPPTSFPNEEYAKRIDKFRRLLVKKGLDGAIISRDVSRLYLTGFESSAGTLIIDADKGAFFIVDFRYILMAQKAMPFLKSILRKSGTKSKIEEIVKKWRRAGLEELDLSARISGLKSRYTSIREWKEIDSELVTLRSVKSPLEQKKLQEAIKANDDLYAWAVPQIVPGMTEWGLRNILRHGADIFGHGESFETIVCSGANGAECHHNPDLTPITKNSAVLMDFGVVLDHYHSDMTRCIHLGKKGRLYDKIYKIVLEANQKAIAAIKPGMTGAEIDAVARKHIARFGYGENFGHSLGHSVGLEIHEGPNFSSGEKRIIKPGMVITVEPGIYLPGRAGVRIEDVVLITKTGCKVLTTSPK